MVSGVSPALAVCALRVVYEDYAACKKRFVTWGQNSKSPPKWRITIYQLICHYTSHGMNIHQERCGNHKSRCILSRFLKRSLGQVYSSNTLLVTESYDEETLTWDVTENVFTAIHTVVFSSYDWRTTKWEKAFRILLQASQCERQQKLSPKSLASVLWKCT